MLGSPLTRVTPRGAGRCRVSDRGDGRRQRLSSDSETEGEIHRLSLSLLPSFAFAKATFLVRGRQDSAPSDEGAVNLLTEGENFQLQPLHLAFPLRAIPLLGEMSAKRTKGFTSPLKEKVTAKPSDEVEYALKTRTRHQSLNLLCQNNNIHVRYTWMFISIIFSTRNKCISWIYSFYKFLISRKFFSNIFISFIIVAF